MSEVPLDLILEVKGHTRAAAGLTDYSPGDPGLPSLPSLSAAIAISDPSPLDICCKNCKGRLLRGVESTICIYCGRRPDHDSILESMCFSSTTGHQWLLHALNLKGTEMVERTTKPEQDEDQNVRKSYTPLSDFLNLKMLWPMAALAEGNRSLEKQLTENEGHWSLNGVPPDKFFLTSNRTGLSDAATEEAEVDDFETSDGKDFSKFSPRNKFQSVQYNAAESSSTQKTSLDSEEWEANFQSADFESKQGNDTSSNHFLSTSVGFEDKFHKSIKNLDVDLSPHIDSVFGYRENVNDGNANQDTGVSTAFDLWNSGDLQNLKPNVPSADVSVDPFITINHDLKVDHSLDNFKDFPSVTNLFPGSDDLQNLSSDVLNGDDGFGSFLSGNDDQKDDNTFGGFKNLSSSADLFPDSDDLQNSSSVVLSGDDGFDAFPSGTNGQKDDPNLDNLKDFSSGGDLFPGSDDLQNLSSDVLNGDEGFGAFLSRSDGPKDEHTFGDFNDLSSSADLFPGSDDLQNPGSIVLSGNDGFDAFHSGTDGQKDDPTLDNFKDFSSSADLFTGSDDLQNLSSNILNRNDGFDTFLSGTDGQKDDLTSDNLREFSSGADLFPALDDFQNLNSNILNDDDGFGAFISGSNGQKDDLTFGDFKGFSSSSDLFPGSDDLKNQRPTSFDSENKLGVDISSDHLPSTSVEFVDKFNNYETFHGSRNLDVDLDPIADSGIGKDVNDGKIINHSSTPTAFDDFNLDDVWKNLNPSISKTDVVFDENKKHSPDEYDSLGNLSRVMSNADSSPQPHDEPVSEDPIDEWSGFVGSTSFGDPTKIASSENKLSYDPSSHHRPSAAVEFRDEFQPSEQVTRSKSLDANLGLHIDSVFGLWEDANDKNRNNSGAALSNWSSDDMWMNMSPSVTNVSVDSDPFNSQKDDHHTMDNSKDFFSSVDLLQPFQYQTNDTANLEAQYQGNSELADNDPVDEWNDFRGSTSIHDPPKVASVENNHVGDRSLQDFGLHSDSVSEVPNDGNDRTSNQNAAASPAFGDWNSDTMWKNNQNFNVSNSYGGFDPLFSTKNNGQKDDDHSTLKDIDIFSGADSFPRFQSSSTVIATNYRSQQHHDEHPKRKTPDGDDGDENDEWNDFIGPTS